MSPRRFVSLKNQNALFLDPNSVHVRFQKLETFKQIILIGARKNVSFLKLSMRKAWFRLTSLEWLLQVVIKLSMNNSRLLFNQRIINCRPLLNGALENIGIFSSEQNYSPHATVTFSQSFNLRQFNFSHYLKCHSCWTRNAIEEQIISSQKVFISKTHSFFVILVPFEIVLHYPNNDSSNCLREDIQWIIEVLREKFMF